MKRCFSNYCSIGIDGRIGYSFDKFRSSSRFMNMAIYSGIGIQKSFKKSTPMNHMIERMYVKRGVESYSEGEDGEMEMEMEGQGRVELQKRKSTPVDHHHKERSE